MSQHLKHKTSNTYSAIMLSHQRGHMPFGKMWKKLEESVLSKTPQVHKGKCYITAPVDF